MFVFGPLSVHLHPCARSRGGGTGAQASSELASLCTFFQVDNPLDPMAETVKTSIATAWITFVEALCFSGLVIPGGKLKQRIALEKALEFLPEGAQLVSALQTKVDKIMEM